MQEPAITPELIAAMLQTVAGEADKPVVRDPAMVALLDGGMTPAQAVARLMGRGPASEQV